MENVNVKVEMDNTSENPIIKFTQHIKGFTRFGKEIKVTPKALAVLNKPGFKAEYSTETITVTIGIGDNHTAELIMTYDAWKALKDNVLVHITTTKEFREKLR